MQQLCVNIATRRSNKVIAKCIMRGKLKQAVTAEVLYSLNEECRFLCRSNKSLQVTNIDDVKHFPNNNWLIDAPLLSNILESILNNDKKKSKQNVQKKLFLAACLLFARCERNSRVSYMVGLMLDKGGISNEVCYF